MHETNCLCYYAILTDDNFDLGQWPVSQVLCT